MSDAELQSKSKTKLKRPSRYKVVLLNDDYTPMDFVVAVLMQIFGKNREEANQIMLFVHTSGKGVAGSDYTLEIATQKTEETHAAARTYGHPLRARIEEMIQ